MLAPVRRAVLSGYKWVRLVPRSRELLKRIEPIPEIGHLPFSVREVIEESIANRVVNAKIGSGYFADRLVVVAALPKTASSVIGSCVSVIQSDSGTDNRRYARYMLANQDSDLRPEITVDFPEGGVLKYHTRATGKNLKVLDLLGVKYAILVRHPADQVVAAYWDVMKVRDRKDLVSKQGWRYDHLQPLDMGFFREDVSADEGIRHMIEDGYLNAVLEWIADWLRFRDLERSLVVRYEDFVSRREGTLSEISSFLLGREMAPATLARCNSIADGYADRRLGDPDRDKKYPRGWSGRIGIREDNLSEQNKACYLSVVKGFLEHYPRASLVRDLYPDLLHVDRTGDSLSDNESRSEERIG